MVQKCIMGSSGGETVNYDFNIYNAPPSQSMSIPIYDGMVTITPRAYEVSQFEGTWYVKKGELTKVFQNPNPKSSVTYSNGILTVQNLTTGYYINAWVYSEV